MRTSDVPHPVFIYGGVQVEVNAGIDMKRAANIFVPHIFCFTYISFKPHQKVRVIIHNIISILQVRDIR